MADEWGGPREVAKVTGTVDAVALVPSDYGSERIRLDLVNVAQEYTDGTADERESRTLFIASEGRPGSEFAGSVRKVAKLDAKSRKLLGALEGRVVSMSVRREDFKGKDGETHTMTLYRVESIGSSGVPDVDDTVALGYLVGKTPAEAIKGRSAFSGTPYADILASKAKTVEHFAVVLKGGVYQAA